MLLPKRLPSSQILLRPCLNHHPPLRHHPHRLASRWTPGVPRSPTRLPPRQGKTLHDPKDVLAGWTEYKASLLRRAKTPDEVQMIEELTPDEALFLMNPDSDLAPQDNLSIVKSMPMNKNYFSGNEGAEQALQDVEKVYERFKHMPKAPSHLWPIRDWGVRQVPEFEPSSTGEHVEEPDISHMKRRTYRQIIKLARELNKIHPVLMPPRLKLWLDQLAPLRTAGAKGVRQRRTIDKYGRSRGNGKRKTARAKVQVLPGEGQIYVNGKVAAEYFTRSKDVENVIWPLQSLCVLGKYNVWVSTFGGGTTGQSEACKLAVARAVLAHDTSADRNLYRKVLRRGDFPTLFFVIVETDCSGMSEDGSKECGEEEDWVT